MLSTNTAVLALAQNWKWRGGERNDVERVLAAAERKRAHNGCFYPLYDGIVVITDGRDPSKCVTAYRKGVHYEIQPNER
eukprot:g82941.t1